MKGTEEYKKAIATAEAKYAEMKPKVIAMYKKYLALIKDNVKLMKEKAMVYYGDAEDLYKQAEAKAIVIYEANKNKTLKALYNEASEIIIDMALTNYGMAKKQVDKKVAELKTETMKQVAEMKVLAKKYYKELSVIVPEVKADLVSIINQSPRGSVELYNETVVAFYPHYVVIRDLITETTEELVAKTTVMTIKAKIALKAKFQELVKQLQGLIERVKGSEYYKELLNMKSLKELKAKVEEMIKILTEKVEKLKSNPALIKYRTAFENKIAELKDLLEEYKKNEKVVRALKVLKQVQKSSEFTVEKVSEMLTSLTTSYSKWAKVVSEMAVEEIKSFAVAFRSNPEETFWTGYANAMQLAELTTQIVKGYTLEDLKELTKEAYEKFLIAAREFVDEITDDWTKATAKMIVNKVEKLIQTIEKEIEKVPGILKTKYAEIEADAKVKFALYKKKANKWMNAQIAGAKSQVAELKEAWEKSPMTAFVYNPIWADLSAEVTNQELVVLVKEAAEYLIETIQTDVLRMVSLAKKEFNARKATLERDLKALKMNVEEMKEKALAKFEDLKKQYAEMKSLTEMKVKEIVAKVDKFLEETRIVDIVEFVQEKIVEVTKYTKETQVKLMELKEKYTKMAVEMYNKYEGEAKAMYAKYEAKAMELYKEYYGKAVATFEEYKAIVMPYYVQYKAEAMTLYEKYSPMVLEKYEEMGTEMKKLMIQADQIYTKTSKDAIRMYKEMTTKQTIKELTVLPMKIKVFVVKNYNELYNKVEAELTKRYADAIKMYTEKYNEAKELITKKYNEII